VIDLWWNRLQEWRGNTSDQFQGHAISTENTMTTTIENVGQELADSALDLHIEMAELQERLDAKKEELRTFANGSKLNIEVPGKGRVDVTEPREGSEKITFVIDEERVGQVTGLKAMLIEKGVAKEEKKQISPAKASVKIKPNA